MFELFWVVMFVWAIKSGFDKTRKEYTHTRDHHQAQIARDHPGWSARHVRRSAARRAQAHWWNELTHSEGGKWKPLPSFRTGFTADRLRAKVAVAEAKASGDTSVRELRERLAAARAAAEAVPPARKPADAPSLPVPPSAGDAAQSRADQILADAGIIRELSPDTDPDDGLLSDRQRQRDADGRSGICAACGRFATADDPLLVAGGVRVHTSHTTDPGSGFHGLEGTSEAEAEHIEADRRRGAPTPFPPAAGGDEPWPEPDSTWTPAKAARPPLAAVPNPPHETEEGEAMTTTTEPIDLEAGDTPYDGMQGALDTYATQAQGISASVGDDLTAASAVHGFDRDPALTADIAHITDLAEQLQSATAAAKAGLAARHAEGAEYHGSGQDAHASAFRPA